VWEWRAFGAPDALEPLERVRQGVHTVDERSDLYLLVRGVDVGLKVRSLAVSDKVELKLRYDREAAGIELWEKVFERKLPLDAPWLEKLAAYLGARDGVAAGGASSARELERLCHEAGLGPPRTVLVRKRIAKAPCPPAYTVEVDELEVSVDGTPARTLRSVAVEAPTLELCRRAGEELGLPRSGTPGVIVAGYPEALARFAGQG
jgi:hypothetical protein